MEHSQIRRGLIAGVLVTSMGVGPLIQWAFGALGPYLTQDLGISRTQIGLLTSVIFVVAGVTSPWLGSLTDGLGTRTSLFGLFGLTAAATAMLAGAPGYAMVLVAAAVVGLPIALANPVSNRMIYEQLPDGQRGLLVGLKLSAIQLAAAIAGFVLPPAAAIWGWRGAMLLVLIPTALGAVLSARIPASRMEEAGSPRREPRRRSAPATPVPALLSWLPYYAFTMGMSHAIVPAYLPLYSFENLGMAASVAGATTGAMGTLGAISRVAWGRHLERIGVLVRPLRLIAAVAAGAILMILVAPVTTNAFVWIGAMLFGASAPVWNVAVMIAIVRHAPANEIGRLTGVLYMGFAAGFVVGPLGFGMVVDTTGSYALGWILTLATCVVSIGLAHLRRNLERNLST